MELTWLGQAGYWIVMQSGLQVMIDPYLSNALEEKNGVSYRREVPIDERYLHKRPDVLILTHIHADHTDFATLDHILSEGEPVSLLAPLNVWAAVRERYGDPHNYIQFDRGIEVTLGGVRFCAVLAAHSDLSAIGVVMEDADKTLYHTGDTMFHRDLCDWINRPIDALLLPMNGQGNNMNPIDAARLTKLLSPKMVFPMHWDMFLQYGCDVQAFTKLFQDDKIQCRILPHYIPFGI